MRSILAIQRLDNSRQKQRAAGINVILQIKLFDFGVIARGDFQAGSLAMFGADHTVKLAFEIARHALTGSRKERIQLILIEQGIFGQFALHVRVKGNFEHLSGLSIDEIAILFNARG